MARVILDASVALKVLLREGGFEEVERQFRLWDERGIEICVPVFFFSEVMNVIRTRVYRNLLSESEGDQVFEVFKLLPALPLATTLPFQEAWDFAKLRHLAQTYDAEYLALAQREGCEFWTADRNLLNALGTARPIWIQAIGTSVPNA